MIYESWYGVFNRKRELLAVEEGEDMALSVALNLEIEPKRPTNFVAPIVILAGVSLGEFVIGIIDVAKIRARERELSDMEERHRLAVAKASEDKTEII